jgi:serine/threonine protein kinase
MNPEKKHCACEPVKIAERIGSVKIESRLHECSMGASFLGRHEGLDLPVVVRFLPREVRADFGRHQKITRELQRLGRIRNAHIAGILDLGEHDGYPYVVTEFIEGVPLSDRIEQQRLSEAEAFSLLMPIAEALAQLWSNGFVYRNLSPYVIHVQSNGAAKLDLTLMSGAHMDARFKKNLTECLAPYWSPEERIGSGVDLTADMWSFGATLYEALTGKQLSETGEGSARSHRPEDPKVLVPGLHEGTRELLLKLLDPQRENRFLSGEAFLVALKSVQASITAPVRIVSPAPVFTDETQTLPALRKPFDVGDVIGNARLLKRLAAGAFGVVYQARHLALDIDVAVKLLPIEAGLRDPSMIEMFLREARTAARIRHKNVIGMYEAGEQDGQHYLIMEFAPGGTVAERLFLHGGKLPVEEVLHVLESTARGLAAAQELNIVHRDIKPHNLMYDRAGDIKIADLGLAKRLVPKGSKATVRMSLAVDQITSQLDSGTIFGTPGYIAPEMAVEPQNVDTRADLYSLGVTAYQLLTGRLPFEGKSAMELMMKHVLEEAPQVREIDASIPEDINAIVTKLMAKRPEHRYQSAREVVRALESLQLSAAA